MEKKQLFQHVGSMQQMAYTRCGTISEGRANDTRVVHVKNGEMQFLVMADKSLDIASLEYRGLNLNFLSKPGLNGRNPFEWMHTRRSRRRVARAVMPTSTEAASTRPS